MWDYKISVFTGSNSADVTSTVSIRRKFKSLTIILFTADKTNSIFKLMSTFRCNNFLCNENFTAITAAGSLG